MKDIRRLLACSLPNFLILICSNTLNSNTSLAKKITGNYTPDPEQRKEYTDTLWYIRRGLNYGSKLLLGSLVSDGIENATSLLDTSAVIAYDAAPEKANETIEKVKKIFS